MRLADNSGKAKDAHL